MSEDRRGRKSGARLWFLKFTRVLGRRSSERMAESVDAGRQTRLLAAMFCESCQLTYVPAPPADETCPKCGQLPETNESTVMVSVDGRSRTTHVTASDAKEVDELVGHDLGVYRLEGLLGAGAMGRVYLARHRDLERSCAVKILPPRLVQNDPAYVLRFSNEGRSTASLVHPNIITVHAIGQERGFHFLEMEFVAGQTLQGLVKVDGPQSPERATAIVARIAQGLACAHDNGVLHRDLKLDNVLLTHTGIPKIADFGLAKRVLVTTEALLSRELVGTPAYMAPELFAGEDASIASDVYALGVCYYVLLTGQYPYHSPKLSDLVRQVQHEPLPNPRRHAPRLTLEMAECLHQLLAKAPGNRPADAHRAGQLLLAVLGQAEDLGSLVEQAFASHPQVSWRREGEKYHLELKFSNGRRQRVLIEPSEHAAADRLVTITSLCARADAHYYETALRLNSVMQHGAVAVREIQGEPYFVMVNNYPRMTVDAEEIRRSVLDVAHQADAFERMLIGVDVN